MTPRPTQVSLVLVALVALSGIYLERQDAHQARQDEEFRVLFDGLRARSTVVDRMVLAARLSLAPSYDPLVDSLKNLRQYTHRVRATVVARDLPPLQRVPLKTFEDHVTVATSKIEKLKRMRSATRNSEKYLVIFLSRQNPANEAKPLRNALALFLADPNSDTDKVLNAAITGLASTTDDELRTASKHASVLSEARRELDTLTLWFLSETFASKAAELHQSQASHRWEAQQAQSQRRLILLAVLVLLSCFSWIVATRAPRKK